MLLEGVQLGRYRLINLLGTGGMGEVYLGEDTHIRRQVAIKVTRAEATPYPNISSAKEAARLFQREVRAIAMLDHPYILPLFDYGEQDMEATVLTYMVMPYRKEGSLSTWLRERGELGNVPALSPQEVAHFVQQAALALSYSHAHSIVHQDVKPSNFLLRNNELSPELPDLLLADFGVAKFTSASASMSQSSRGTPTYMAPEQWSGQPVAASDQYALAVMAYQLLTGSLPFSGRQEQVMYQHFHVEPSPPSARNRRISKEVDSIILRALSKKPEERFPSIAAFSGALQQAIKSSEPARSPSPAPPVASGALPKPTNPLPYNEGDMRATVAISSQEATTGTTRTLNLPGGRRITVPIPSGLPDGQVIRLENQGEITGDGTTGALVLKIAVAPDQPVQALEPIKIDDRTYRSDASKIRSQKPAFDTPLPGGAGRPAERLSSSRAFLIITLVVVVTLVGSIFSIVYFNSAHTTTSITTTGTPPPYALGNPVLNDQLTDNNQGHAWDEISGSCDFTNGGYQVSTQQGNLQPCFAKHTSFTNFTYEAHVTIAQGDAAGIVYRADSSQQNYYFFYIDAHGGYYLYNAFNNKLWTTLITGNSSAINTRMNSLNLLAVVANGSQIDLYINYQKVDSITDSSYSGGEIGVAAYSYSNSTQAVFSNARVWTS